MDDYDDNRMDFWRNLKIKTFENVKELSSHISKSRLHLCVMNLKLEKSGIN
jgi:hypothetical protein